MIIIIKVIILIIIHTHALFYIYACINASTYVRKGIYACICVYLRMNACVYANNIHVCHADS